MIGCKYSTTMNSGCFIEHCQQGHNWGKYPCTYSNCNYQSYSPKSFKIHQDKTHVRESKTITFSIKCDRKDCDRSFRSPTELKRHLQIHDNDVIKCTYCQWGASRYKDFLTHMNAHFRIKLYECEKCPEKFYVLDSLKTHLTAYHEKDHEMYGCCFCEFKTNVKV